MLFFPLVNVKMPTIVGILTIMSRKNFMLSCVEHEKSFITSGPDLGSDTQSQSHYCSYMYYCNIFRVVPGLKDSSIGTQLRSKMLPFVK